MSRPSSSRPAKVSVRICATAILVAIAALSGCTTEPTKVAVPTPPALPPQVAAPHQLTQDEPEFTRLPNMTPGHTPVRVGVLLPLTASSPSTRLLAGAMLKAAQLALFEANNRDILLITEDENATPAEAAEGARKLIAQGAEVIVGPLFSQSVAAVAPIARDRGVPMLAFSTDTSVAGNGVYLLSFLPQNEVARVVSYAAARGHKSFAGMIPQTAYGDVVGIAFQKVVTQAGGQIADVERFSPSTGAIVEPAAAIAKSHPDAILIAQGGPLLRGIAPALAFDHVDVNTVKLMGTGLWDDPNTSREPLLHGGWFAGPEPNADGAFNAKFRATFGSTPPQLASLAYDAITLVALLSSGTPYHRFTRDALIDPNGFAGVDGIFRFNVDGTVERGLAVLAVAPGGTFQVVDPAPKTFQKQGS